jgi:hypothetical protein
MGTSRLPEAKKQKKKKKKSTPFPQQIVAIRAIFFFL